MSLDTVAFDNWTYLEVGMKWYQAFFILFLPFVTYTHTHAHAHALTHILHDRFYPHCREFLLAPLAPLSLICLLYLIHHHSSSFFPSSTSSFAALSPPVYQLIIIPLHFLHFHVSLTHTMHTILCFLSQFTSASHFSHFISISRESLIAKNAYRFSYRFECILKMGATTHSAILVGGVHCMSSEREKIIPVRSKATQGPRIRIFR